MKLITGPWMKGPRPFDALTRMKELLDQGRELELIDKTPPLPSSGLIDRASFTKLKKELRGLAKLEETPPYRQDDVLYAIEKTTKIRHCYVVEGSEWTVWAMERAARLNLDNFGRVRGGKWLGRVRDKVQLLDEIDLQLSHVPQMVPAKQVRKEYAEYFGY